MRLIICGEYSSVLSEGQIVRADRTPRPDGKSHPLSGARGQRRPHKTRRTELWSGCFWAWAGIEGGARSRAKRCSDARVSSAAAGAGGTRMRRTRSVGQSVVLCWLGGSDAEGERWDGRARVRSFQVGVVDDGLSLSCCMYVCIDRLSLPCLSSRLQVDEDGLRHASRGAAEKQPNNYRIGVVPFTARLLSGASVGSLGPLRRDGAAQDREGRTRAARGREEREMMQVETEKRQGQE